MAPFKIKKKTPKKQNSKTALLRGLCDFIGENHGFRFYSSRKGNLQPLFFGFWNSFHIFPTLGKYRRKNMSAIFITNIIYCRPAFYVALYRDSSSRTHEVIFRFIALQEGITLKSAFTPQECFELRCITTCS